MRSASTSSGRTLEVDVGHAHPPVGQEEELDRVAGHRDHAGLRPGDDHLGARRHQPHPDLGAAEHQPARRPQRLQDGAGGALRHVATRPHQAVAAQDVLVVDDELDGVEGRVDPVDPRGGPARRAGADRLDEGGPVTRGDRGLPPLGAPRQGRDPDAGGEVGPALAHHEVGGQVAGAPGVAQGRCVRSELEEGVAQGPTFGLDDGSTRIGGHASIMRARALSNVRGAGLSTRRGAVRPSRVGDVTWSRARAIHLVVAAVAVAALVLQTALVVSGASVLAETEVPPLAHPSGPPRLLLHDPEQPPRGDHRGAAGP